MLWLFLFACSEKSSSSDATDVDTVEPADTAEATDWSTLLSGSWEGTESSPTMGVATGEYLVSTEDGERFDISYAPGGKVSYLKLYFSGVVADPADPEVGYVTVPQQIYAEGQTGPAKLDMLGDGAYDLDGATRAFDGRIDLGVPEVALEATITVFGGSEILTFRLNRAQ
jgi:hypothetical protein